MWLSNKFSSSKIKLCDNLFAKYNLKVLVIELLNQALNAMAIQIYKHCKMKSKQRLIVAFYLSFISTYIDSSILLGYIFLYALNITSEVSLFKQS